MQTYSHRPYRTDDLDTLMAVLRARPAERIADYPSFADLREILDTPEGRENVALWLDDAGRPVGYALLDFSQTYAGLTFEGAGEEAGMLDEMLAWGWAACFARYRGDSPDLNVGIKQCQAAHIAALQRAGFILQPDSVVHMSRDLRQPIPTPNLPPGYRIRELAGEIEAPAWVDLHRAAFGTQNMTLEYRLAMMRQPGYDPHLDLVAVAADGSLAAYVYGHIDREEIALSGVKGGYTDPVATYPAHQRRGLSRALLLAAVAGLRERGMDFARLSTLSDNLAMQAAARSAGFRETGRSLRYARPFQAGVDEMSRESEDGGRVSKPGSEDSSHALEGEKNR